jgi:hypothetical protein
MIFFDIHKTLSYDPLNPEHKATGQGFLGQLYNLYMYIDIFCSGLWTSSRYDSSKKDNIEIMVSCFLTNNIELTKSGFSNPLYKKQMTKHAEITQR